MTSTFLFVALAIASVSPAEAKTRADKAGAEEAKSICEKMEERLCDEYSGGEFTHIFAVRHWSTATHVGEHFSDNWDIEWNHWYGKDALLWHMNGKPKREAEESGTDRNGEKTYRWLSRYKITLRPKGAEKAK